MLLYRIKAGITGCYFSLVFMVIVFSSFLSSSHLSVVFQSF
jgi:hypothetical protein